MTENNKLSKLQQVIPDGASLSKLSEVLKLEGENGCKRFITENLEGWKTVEVKIGIMGRVKSGKSSLVNSLLGLKPKEPGAAATGIGEETTEIREYSFPSNKLIKLYDIPGMSTITFPKVTYVEKSNAKVYDIAIIVTKEVYTEDEIFLAEELRKLNKTFFYVRTFIHSSIEQEKDDNGVEDPNLTINKIRNQILQSIKKSSGTTNELYLTDKKYLNKYDFPKLQSRIADSLALKKREALFYSLHSSDITIINEKIILLQNRIFWASALAGTIAITGVFITKLQIKIIRDNSKLFIQVLGLNRKTLKNLAEMTKTPFESLLNLLEPPNNPSAIIGYADEDDNIFRKMIEKLDLNNAELKSIDSWLLNMPIYSTFKSARMTYQILYAILNIMEKCAKDLLQLATETFAKYAECNIK